MGGGLIQLKFLGDEAEFFVGNPQISFFKSVFKSFSNYSKNLMDIYFEAPLDFNKDTYANIPVHGDLIQDMYLNLNIKVNVSDTFDLTISGTTFSSTKNAVFYEYNSSGTQDLYLYNYIYTLTNTNITNLKITEIGSDINLYDSGSKNLDLTNITTTRLNCTYDTNNSFHINVRFLKEDLTKFIKEITFEIDEYIIEKHNTNWLLMYNNLFNNDETLHKINNELKFITPKMFNRKIQLYIPLRFFFTKHSQSSLPIAALYRSDVNIKIKTNNQSDVFLSNKIISSVEINKAVLSANYIHLDVNEKNYFLKNKQHLLIEQLQYQTNDIINGLYDNIELTFSYLSKYLIWRLPYKYILDKARIVFNNNDLFYEQTGEYFHLLQPFECNLGSADTMTRMEENQDPNGTYYVYSFCLHPSSRQPSGLCNFSRIDDKFLYLQTEYIKNDLNINTKIPIDVYSVNFNFLHIEKGKCKLEF